MADAMKRLAGLLAALVLPCPAWAAPPQPAYVSGTIITGAIAKGAGAQLFGTGDLTGDVATSGTLATTISANAVTYAKMQQASASTLLGNPTGSTANISQITLGTGLSFSGSVLNSTGGGGGGGPPYCGLAGGTACTMTGDIIVNPGPSSNLAGGYMGAPLVNAAHTTNYTLALTDAGAGVVMNCSSACTVTIPANATVAFPVGTIVPVVSIGAGVVTVAPAVGVNLYANASTVSSSISLSQYATAPIHQAATVDNWLSSASAPGAGLYSISAGIPTTTAISSGAANITSAIVNGALVVSAGASAPSSPQLNGVYFTAPSTPYTVAVLVLPNFTSVKYTGPALGYYDSTTGKLRALVSFGSATGFYSYETWASPTSRAGLSEPGTPRSPTGGPYWIGIRDNGTVISFSISYDGANFSPLPTFSETKSGGYLANYNKIFLGMFNDCESGSDGCTANDNLSVTYLVADPNGASRHPGP